MLKEILIIVLISLILVFEAYRRYTFKNFKLRSLQKNPDIFLDRENIEVPTKFGTSSYTISPKRYELGPYRMKEYKSANQADPSVLYNINQIGVDYRRVDEDGNPIKSSADKVYPPPECTRFIQPP